VVTIVRLTDKPCFLCNSRKDTAEVRFKDRTFAGVVCKDHLFQLLQKRTEAVEKAQSQKTTNSQH
jgi:hypothetical protein